MSGFVSLRALEVCLRRNWRVWRVDILSRLVRKDVAHESVYFVTVI